MPKPKRKRERSQSQSQGSNSRSTTTASSPSSSSKKRKLEQQQQQQQQAVAIDEILQDATETLKRENQKLRDGTHPELPRIIRKDRERRVNEDQCIICLTGKSDKDADDGGEISMPVEMFSACCGQSYHINCYIQQILRGANTANNKTTSDPPKCGVCRNNLPKLDDGIVDTTMTSQRRRLLGRRTGFDVIRRTHRASESDDSSIETSDSDSDSDSESSCTTISSDSTTISSDSDTDSDSISDSSCTTISSDSDSDSDSSSNDSQSSGEPRSPFVLSIRDRNGRPFRLLD